MINGWVVCLGDVSNPRAFFKAKSEADAYAASIPGLVVFEGKATSPFYYVNLSVAPF